MGMITSHLRAVGAGALLFFAATQMALATPLFYEPFNYTAGANLKDQPGWTEPGGLNDNVLDKIRASSLTVPGLFSSGNSVRTGGKYSFDSLSGDDNNPNSFIGGNGNTFWFSFVLQREVAGNGGTTNPDYGGLLLGGNPQPVNNLFIGKPGALATDKYVLEAADGTLQQASNVSEAVGTTAFLAVKITFHDAGAEDISLYVNPTPGASEGSLSANATSQLELFAFNDFHISTGHNSNWIFDELWIGTTYADVSPVPEPTFLATLLLTFPALFARRRINRSKVVRATMGQ